MIRINYVRQAIHFFIFVIIQIPVLYKMVLFESAFAFFYVGFLLLIPYGISRSIGMLLAFSTGLLIDIFSSTPGMHASACVFILFVKDYWFLVTLGDPDDQINLSWSTVGFFGLMRYLFPLIFIHHAIIFSIENLGFISFGSLLVKVIMSSLYSLIIIVSISYLLTPRSRRA